MDREMEEIVDEYIVRFGSAELRAALTNRLNNSASVLTIVANGGVHPLRDDLLRGEIFVASQGSLDFSSRETAEKGIREALVGVAKMLKAKRWKTVYLVPFGPTVLSLGIKMLVYRILSQETVDVLHIGEGVHVDIQLDTRQISLEAQANPT
ncbi:hypothetical protein PAQ31011_00654 [Pandoraea aquatica]|uniref:SMODS-associated and fused to various effectors domain-containing protein n=1 Tax=Pandoraea aquatica TaxID=2508290 RepID=A0A5E4SBE5_9BURK|nr:hypothetical protein [Pandoraea aquatica]VVD71894.1 hypothetical protein PAQ31011_00654 [Pandoraea aquatica]